MTAKPEKNLMPSDLPKEGRAIEQRSMEIIERELGDRGFDDRTAAVVKRVIHATADFSFADTLRFHPQAIAQGTAALRAGRLIVCDVRMLQAGMTQTKSEVICAISDPEVISKAKESGCTRAAMAMELLSDRLDGAILAIGNAPTALWKIMEIAANGGAQPALVVGLPVGFVGAKESKLALLASDLCYITNTDRRGGSPCTAAVVNALALLSRQ